MKTSLEETEEKWDAYPQDDDLWGNGITDTVKRVVAATEQDEREGRKADTEGFGLEASIHADLTLFGRPKMPEDHQQRQPRMQPKSVLMLKPKPNPNPKPILAPPVRPTLTLTMVLRTTSKPKGAMTPVRTPTRRWETVPPRNQKNLTSTAPALTTCSSMADRRLILR